MAFRGGRRGPFSLSLNPRSCAASSMARALTSRQPLKQQRLNPRSCAASSMAGESRLVTLFADVSIRVRARLHRWRGRLLVSPSSPGRLNPRSCAASSMAFRSCRPRTSRLPVSIRVRARLHRWRADQAAEKLEAAGLNPRSCAASSMAEGDLVSVGRSSRSQSAFVRGFIDGLKRRAAKGDVVRSQSAFVRGFIDGVGWNDRGNPGGFVSIRVRARLHRWRRPRPTRSS